MDSQPPRKNKGFTRTVIIPMAGPLVNGAGKLSDATQGVLLFGAKQFGVDGYGVRITKHWGIAAESAARAWWGNGPLRNGGRGMAGGNAKLEMIGNVVGGVTLAAVVGASLYGDYLIAKASEQPAPTITCENCREEHLAAPDEADTPGVPVSCPHCGHGSPDQE